MYFSFYTWTFIIGISGMQHWISETIIPVCAPTLYDNYVRSATLINKTHCGSKVFIHHDPIQTITKSGRGNTAFKIHTKF